jgi:hypothetical protein
MASQFTPKNYTAAERLQVWKHHISREAAFCPMCLIFGHGRQFVITPEHSTIYRLTSSAAYNELLSNLRPVCVPCNSQMGSKNVYDTGLFVYLYLDYATNITRPHSDESDEVIDPEVTEEEYDVLDSAESSEAEASESEAGEAEASESEAGEAEASESEAGEAGDGSESDKDDTQAPEAT